MHTRAVIGSTSANSAASRVVTPRWAWAALLFAGAAIAPATAAAQCPDGFQDQGVACSKPGTYSRGVGYLLQDVSKARCENDNPQGCERIGAPWYPKCRAGFNTVGLMCIKACPAGFSAFGLHCTKPASYARPNFGINFGETNLGGAMARCEAVNPDGCEQYGALVSPKCRSGFQASEIFCVPTCPAGMNDIGLMCGTETYGRGAGYLLQTDDKGACEADHPQGCERCGAPFFPKCQSGFQAFGCNQCVRTCPAGMTDVGLSCLKGAPAELPDVPDASGGLTIATNRTTVDQLPVESCDPMRVSNDYYIAPRGMLDWKATRVPNFRITLNEPLKALAMAAVVVALGTVGAAIALGAGVVLTATLFSGGALGALLGGLLPVVGSVAAAGGSVVATALPTALTAVTGLLKAGIPSQLINLPPPASPTPYQAATNGPLHDLAFTGKSVGANEGRVRADLRAAAQAANPLASLCRAAELFILGDRASGNAFADLSVTGKASFAKFRQLRPQERNIVPCLRTKPTVRKRSPVELERAAAAALNRAYEVATVIRAGGWPTGPKGCAKRRSALGWIAVSGEDDQPHRPVNVPSAEFPQYALQVKVQSRIKPGIPGQIVVNTRYMIAHATPPVEQQVCLGAPSQSTPAARQACLRNCEIPLRACITAAMRTGNRAGAMTCKQNSMGCVARCGPGGGAPSRQIPADLPPKLATNAEVLLFIHGMDSRAEEALLLTEALHRISKKTGKNWTVIAMDLPTSGYTDNIDHERISRIQDVGEAKFNPQGSVADIQLTDLAIFVPQRQNGLHKAPLVDFIQEFIAAFVDTLDSQLGGRLKPRIRAVVGGSLGGNMSMRLGRRPNTPWVKKVVPWSPGAIWPSYAERSGEKHPERMGPAIPWLWAGGDPRVRVEKDFSRRLFFHTAFDWNVSLLKLKPQASEWTRPNWGPTRAVGMPAYVKQMACKEPSMIGARLDRHETYNGLFRLWHWRLGMEQLVFSHQDAPQSDPLNRLYKANEKDMLLLCGWDDTGGDLCLHTRRVAADMTQTKGKALFLKDTGHSIMCERPCWLAQQMVTFLGAPSAACHKAPDTGAVP